MATQYPGVHKSGRDTYAYRFRKPPDPETGKRGWVARGGFPTAYAASRARTEHMARLYDAATPPDPGDRTVTDAVEEWISARRRARASTTRNRQNLLRLYITPYIGAVRLRDLNVAHITTWLDALETRSVRGRPDQRGLAPQTIQRTTSLLRAVLSHEAQQRRLASNPLEQVDAPPRSRRIPAVWDDDEIQRAMPYLAADSLAPLWWLLLLSQLRPGECAGLEWGDIDLERGTLEIRRTRTYTADGRLVIGTEPKTPRSARTAELPTRCIDALRALHAEHVAIWEIEPGWNPHRRVFPGRRGMLAHSAVIDRLERICTAAGVTRITPHGLRHTGATWLARLNVPPSTISQRLGHTSVAFTLDNYVHGGRAEQQDASARLDALLAESGQDVTADVTYTNMSLPVSPSRAAK